ncbi:MAG TPA: succinate dehydrogenase iron-sulfur subunit [Campylobacterales bacterium]|nr:succinate dehydrogenase iron-sulfur subunit [Campylobacterales bacterium]HIO71144.1 succinate dehydrogenase iron-sulfur subunit [Campylobacterales bacterium]
MEKSIQTKNITVKVFRFNGDTDVLPYYKEYKLEVSQEDVVLDVLNRIKWEHSGSLSYRRSCRHGICGSCAVKVNNKGVLACKERVFDLIDLFGDELVIDPLNKQRVIKDLVIDKKDFWDKYDAVQPYLVADVEEEPEKENLVTPDEVEKIADADYCIQCGACYYSCPVIEVNPEFIGPAAFAKAYRFTSDNRDDAKIERLETVSQMGSGVWDCVKCFECAQVCPKDVNPIDKITRLHQQTFQEGVAESNVATRHAVGFKHSIEQHGFLDEGGLVFYSEGPLGMVQHIPEAVNMFKNGKIPMPWNLPKSKNLEEIKKIVKISSTAKF